MGIGHARVGCGSLCFSLAKMDEVWSNWQKRSAKPDEVAALHMAIQTRLGPVDSPILQSAAKTLPDAALKEVTHRVEEVWNESRWRSFVELFFDIVFRNPSPNTILTIEEQKRREHTIDVYQWLGPAPGTNVPTQWVHIDGAIKEMQRHRLAGLLGKNELRLGTDMEWWPHLNEITGPDWLNAFDAMAKEINEIRSPTLSFFSHT